MISRTFIALLIFAAALTGGSLAHAQTGTASTTVNTTSTTATTPGTPDTGAGGAAAANEMAVGVAAIVVGAGAIYLARRAALR